MNCPWCEQKVEVEEEWLGTMVNCPACQKEFIIKKDDSAGMPQLKISNGNTKKNKMPLGKRILRTALWTVAVIFVISSVVLSKSAFAQMFMAYCYGEGVGPVSQNMTKAVKWLRKAAENGNADAQFGVGAAYLYGKGVEKNYQEAVKWLCKSVEQGDPDAMELLGKCYEEGLGVEKNLSVAIEWYRKAAELGNNRAKEALNRINGVKKPKFKFYGFHINGQTIDAKNVEPDKLSYQDTLEYIWQVIIVQGKDAQKDWVMKNYVDFYNTQSAQDKQGLIEESVKYFRQAAAAGSAEAKCQMGNCYWNGCVVSGIRFFHQDKAEAIRWYRMAAARGNAYAQRILGMYHE